MMDATVYATPNGFHVNLLLDHVSVDVAGPFDDLTDATLMAERSVFDGGRVTISDGIRIAAGTDGFDQRGLRHMALSGGMGA